MSQVLNHLEPNTVFKYFEEIAQIPHGSGNEKGISDYLVAFAKEHNLEVIQDEALNVIIKKPGTSGYEKAPTVIIQGHMDMVCEKNQGIVHNFEKDPLKLRIDGDFIYATDTTLGADNGIAIAYGLAILATDVLHHPPIELLITTEEETGMGGAMALKLENLQGRILINLDSEEEGKLLVSCSGGTRGKVVLPIQWSDSTTREEVYEIKLRGLKGGHSGMDINKGRGNANKVLGRILYDLSERFEIKIGNIKGGAKSNAIPREGEAVLLLNPTEVEEVKQRINAWSDILANEYRASDPGIRVEFSKSDNNVSKIFSKETAEKVIQLLYLIPNGVQTMSTDIKELVQSSTNLGVVTTEESEIHFDNAIRSSVKTLKQDIVQEFQIACKTVGAQFITGSDYPEWQYDPHSKIRMQCVKVYETLRGNSPEIIAIHAGVECGLFKEKFGEIDMISFGPDLFDVHTPDEHMSISSVKRTWEYLLAVLQEIKA